MKLLFLANRIPYPPYRGDKLKIYNLAKRLAGRHELHLLTFTQNKDELQYKKELEKYFKEVHLIHLPKWRSAMNCIAGLWQDVPAQVLYFQSAAMKAKLADVLKQHHYDAIHVQHIRMAQYLDKREDTPRILDLPDAFSLYWERRKIIPKNFAQRVFENIEQKRLLRYEDIIKKYNMALACSQEDVNYLIEELHANNIRLLPNGVDMQTFSPRNHDYSHNHTLLFTGNMDYVPNIDAVTYFVKDIFPLIRAEFPTVRLVIAGQRPVSKVLALAGEHVTVTGFVKDLAQTYNDASVVIAPLRFGAGTQNKVLEAMAMGVPVVCSNIGFKGLGINSGEGAVMQTDTQAFADSVKDLLRSETMRTEVGMKGTTVIKERFDWDKIALILEKYFEEVMKQKD